MGRLRENFDLGSILVVGRELVWVVVVLVKVGGLRRIGTCLAMLGLVMMTMNLSFWILGLCMELAPFVSVFDARDSCVLCCLCL